MTTPIAVAAARKLAPKPQTEAEKWAAYVKFNPANAARVVAEDRAKKAAASAARPPLGGGLTPALPSPTGPQVNPLPKLPTAAQGSTTLPFDGDAALAQAQLQAQKNMFESQYTGESQRIERDYGLQKRAVQDQMPAAQRGLLEDYAGRGLANSSGYAYDQGDQQSQFAKLLSELDQGKTEGFADLLRQRGAFNDSWATQLQAVQAAAARRMADQAGNLGLNDPAPTGNENLFNGLWNTPQAQPTPQPTPAPAPKPAAPAQTAEQKAWAAYVAYNPTNAARIMREAEEKKKREWAAYQAYNPTNAARVAAAARR